MKTIGLVLLLAGTALTASFDRHDLDELKKLLERTGFRNDPPMPEDFLTSGARNEHIAKLQKKQNNKDGNGNSPHLIYILLDDMGFNHISWNNADVITPNLQALADEGVVLDSNYAQAVCSPSRGSLMFGKYAFNTGMQHDAISYQAPECADLNTEMLPEKLKGHGYDTYMVGKWHLGFCKQECTPLNRGFDKFYGFYQPLIDYYTHSVGYSGNVGYDLRDDLTVDTANNGTYVTDLFTQQAIQMIEEHDDNSPMFLYLSHAAVHTPLQAPQRFLDMYPGETNAYKKLIKAMVSSVDESIGLVVEALKSQGMYENSVIMFSSDNGGQAFIGDNYPLRGAKASIFEGGTRVPGMFHSPLATVSGTRVEGLFHISDWHTTMLSLVGADTSDLDGVDQTDMLFHGGDSARDEIVYNIDSNFPQYLGAYGIRVGDYKLIRGFGGMYDGWEQYGGVDYTHSLDYVNSAAKRRRNVNQQRAYYIDYAAIDAYITASENTYQLFNLADDPEERVNLAAAMPDKVAELEARINDYAATAKEVHTELQTDVPEASPNNFNGIWESGWC